MCVVVGMDSTLVQSEIKGSQIESLQQKTMSCRAKLARGESSNPSNITNPPTFRPILALFTSAW